MTGYGKGEAPSPLGRVTVEMRSLNHRYLDLSTHAPAALAGADEMLRDLIKRRLQRGRVTIAVTTQRSTQAMETASVDLPLARQYVRLLRALRQALHVPGEISLQQILTLPNLIAVQPKRASDAALRAAVKTGAARALEGLVRMRQSEGRALARELCTRLQRLSRGVDAITQRAPLVIEAYRQRLRARVASLTAPASPARLASPGEAGGARVDQGRLETEIALFAQSADVTEELARLRSHIAQFSGLLDGTSEAGRTLDFLAQEMFREISTVAAKANDAQITKQTILVKSEIEKIREQVQNVE
ncbi:MAG: YicC family protein [Candidatus Omnitrophica bacterium]|nr:YicC family protein [Candidatus Omnitrophota bacterium]